MLAPGRWLAEEAILLTPNWGKPRVPHLITTPGSCPSVCTPWASGIYDKMAAGVQGAGATVQPTACKKSRATEREATSPAAERAGLGG